MKFKDWLSTEELTLIEAFSVLKYSKKGDGNYYGLKIGKKRVGHIGGIEKKSYKRDENNELISYDYFDVMNVYVDEDQRGKGWFQQALQEIANMYPDGIRSSKFQTSPSFEKSMLKMQTYRDGRGEHIILPLNKNIVSLKLKENLEQHTKNLFVLIGPPAVGKSTWIKKTFTETPYIVSRDDIVDEVSSELGWTYDDMFSAPSGEEEHNEKYGKVIKSPPFMTWQPFSYTNVVNANNEVTNRFKTKLNMASSSNKDIVVDMTNMTVKSRQSILGAISKENILKKIAVVFPFQGSEHIIKKIAEKRAKEIKLKGGSKAIPPEVLDRMMNSYQPVSPSEGFDQVVEFDNRENLKKLIEKEETIK